MSESSFLEDFSSLFDLGTVLENEKRPLTSKSLLFSASSPTPLFPTSSASSIEFSNAQSHNSQHHYLYPPFSASSSSPTKTRIRSEIIKLPRVILTADDTVQVIDDEMLAYYEEEILSSTASLPSSSPSSSQFPKFRLNLSRGCGRDKRDTDHYVIPSLRLNYIDNNEYMEPIRSREKCWVLDSQRQILNEDPDKQDKYKLKLGEHKSLDPFPPLVWCPPLQTSLRKRSLLRVSAVISDTHCFVNIFGLGVAGRITAPGGTTNRMLLIEAYSVWNSTIYSVPVPIPHLRILLRGREELLVPGRKKDLLRALIPLLYFDYEVVYSIPLESTETKITKPIRSQESQSHPETTTESETAPVIASELLTPSDEIPSPSMGSRSSSFEQQPPQLQSQPPQPQPPPQHEEKTLFIHHLDKFTLPPGYPQSIADIIRAMTTSSDLLDTFLPNKLNQILKIGPLIRENGPVVRRRDIEEIKRQERVEEERKRKIWQETPRRYKGLMSGKCIRKYGKFLIVTSYRMPLKPTVMSIKGHVFDECQKLGHFLDLGSLGQSNGIALNPRKWDESLAKSICSKATRLLTTGESTRSTLFLKYETKTGSETQLKYPKSCNAFELRRSVTKERNQQYPSRFSFYVPDYPLHLPHPYFVPSNSCLSTKSQRKKRLYPGDPLCGSCQPRRDVNRPRRLLTRGRKIGHMYGIYSLYQIGKLSSEPLPSIKEVEEKIETHYYANEVLPSFLGPLIEIMIEIYFSENPTAVAVQRGDVVDFGEEVKNKPTVLRISLQRGDLCRLIGNKYHLRTAFRSGHLEFEQIANENEVKLVEDCWLHIGDDLLQQCRWRRTSEGMSFGKGYYAKLVQATSLLSIESIDVTTEVLDSKASKMKVEKPQMVTTMTSTTGTKTAGGRSSKQLLLSESRRLSMMSKDVDLLCNSMAELVLVISSVMHSQTCQVVSLSERRPNVTLQVLIWQKGISFGVVCFDRIQKDICILQPSPPEQETICVPLQAAGREEIFINLSLYATSLTYQEEEIQKEHGTSTGTSTWRGYVTLESNQDEEEERRLTKEYSTNSYEQLAVQESKIASAAAKARQTSSINEEKEGDGVEIKNPWENKIDETFNFDEEMEDKSSIGDEGSLPGSEDGE